MGSVTGFFLQQFFLAKLTNPSLALIDIQVFSNIVSKSRDIRFESSKFHSFCLRLIIVGPVHEYGTLHKCSATYLFISDFPYKSNLL